MVGRSHPASTSSYGHPGELNYDNEERQWSFSMDQSKGRTFEQLLPLTQCQLPSLQKITRPKRKPQNLLRAQVNSLVKSWPETYPGNTFASALCRDQSVAQTGPRLMTDQLFSVGRAVDVERQPGYRTVPIIAMPCGEAGHILRLIRPRVEGHGWGMQSSIKLSLLDAASLYHGHWAGTGGTIHRILFADDGNRACTWLAVQQAFVTTIFRPLLGSSSTPAVTPVGYGMTFSPSRLSPNPVAVLTAERTGSGRHVDVSFNPYYTRQFAVVDDIGSWSIWDIEGRIRKRSALDLTAGKKGHIYDGHVHDSALKDLDSTDGWHKLLWVSNVSTIVVCNRRVLAVFDVKSTPTRLHGAEVLTASSTDWILDMKRSLLNPNHLFILTSSRVFWIRINAAEEDKDGQYGAKVILSQRHFRDPNDETMKLTVLSGDDGEITLFISSAKSLLVDSYSFRENTNGIGGPTSSRGSFTLSGSLDTPRANVQGESQGIYFLQATVLRFPSRSPGPERQYVEHNVRFYQVWILSSDLGLKTTLCCVYGTTHSGFIVAPPNRKVSLSRRRIFEQDFDEDFVVPDGDIEEELGEFNTQLISGVEGLANPNEPFSINWSSIFKAVFRKDAAEDMEMIDSPLIVNTIDELLQSASNRIVQAGRVHSMPMSTLLEFSPLLRLSEELETIAPILQNFLEVIEGNRDLNISNTLVVSNINSCPGIDFPIGGNGPHPDLLKIYDQIGEHWMVSLPMKVSNLSRLAKFRLACKIAVDLYLSSIAVSLRNELSGDAHEPDNPESHQISLPILHKVCEPPQRDSPPLLSSQVMHDRTQNPSLSLPTLRRTPSLYSHGSAASAEATEDPAITRLRQYAVSIEPSPAIGTSSILFHWPSSPGLDPAQYEWDMIRKDTIQDDNIGDSHKRQRDDDRRRRRIETFLDRERMALSEISSQPTFPSFGSQPAPAQNVASSQTTGDLPMTQPGRGTFGSRIAVAKKKLKKRTAGF